MSIHTRSNFYSLICKSFERLKPEPTHIFSQSNIGLSSIDSFWQQYSQQGLSGETNDLLESSQKPSRTHCIITKRGGEIGVAGIF